MRRKAQGFAQLLVLVALVLVSLLGFQTWRLGQAQLEIAELQSQYASEKAAAMERLALANKKARDVEEGLNEKVALQERIGNEKIHAISVQRDALVVRVRRAKAAAHTRVSKATADPADDPSGRVGDAAELSGSLGVEDVEEAARADTIRVELLTCYAQYEAARLALNIE